MERPRADTHTRPLSRSTLPSPLLQPPSATFECPVPWQRCIHALAALVMPDSPNVHTQRGRPGSEEEHADVSTRRPLRCHIGAHSGTLVVSYSCRGSLSARGSIMRWSRLGMNAPPHRHTGVHCPCLALLRDRVCRCADACASLDDATGLRWAVCGSIRAMHDAGSVQICVRRSCDSVSVGVGVRTVGEWHGKRGQKEVWLLRCCLSVGRKSRMGQSQKDIIGFSMNHSSQEKICSTQLR